jgi:hypothetical protein
MSHMAQFHTNGSVPKRADTPGTLRYLFYCLLLILVDLVFVLVFVWF